MKRTLFLTPAIVSPLFYTLNCVIHKKKNPFKWPYFYPVFAPNLSKHVRLVDSKFRAAALILGLV